MTLKDMKIRLTNENNLAVVAEALHKAGYAYIVGDSAFDNATALYAYDTGIVLKTTDESGAGSYFDRHQNEEHFLFNGQFVTKYYFKQPETPKVNIPERYENPQNEEDKAVKGAFDKVIGSMYEPIGLLPKAIHDKQRMYEILDAMRRYVDADKKIPMIWIAELDDLGGEFIEEEF